MRIIQIATIITPDNAYGGPTTVAFNQCRALIDAGHDVTLAASARGFEGELPTEIQGVPVRLFPAVQAIPGAGFAGVASPGLLKWLATSARRADAVHVHLARDFVTLPAASLAQNLGVPTYLQTHGMIDPSDRLLARPLDAVLTRRVLRAAHRVFWLTPVERDGLVEVAGSSIRLEELHNGVPVPPLPERVRTDQHATVLYLARLQDRKRPLAFVDMARQLAPTFPDAEFVLVGPDEGQGDAVAADIAVSGLGNRLRWEGPADRAACTAAMEAADIYVLPSVDEPYPMSVLEAMALQLPVVITDSCGLAPAVERGQAGTVVGRDPELLVPAVRALLADPDARRTAAASARRLVEQEFSMVPIREQLVAAYSSGASK